MAFAAVSLWGSSAYLKAYGYENDVSETHRHYETFLTDAARQQKRIRHPIKKAQ